MVNLTNVKELPDQWDELAGEIFFSRSVFLNIWKRLIIAGKHIICC